MLSIKVDISSSDIEASEEILNPLFNKDLFALMKAIGFTVSITIRYCGA